MLFTQANTQLSYKKMCLGSNTWSQLATESSSFLQLAPRALAIIKLSFLDNMQPTWASRHIFGNSLFIVANSWTQLVTYYMGHLEHCYYQTLRLLIKHCLLGPIHFAKKYGCKQQPLVSAGHRCFCLFTAGTNGPITARTRPCFLQLVWRALAMRGPSFHDKMRPACGQLISYKYVMLKTWRIPWSRLAKQSQDIAKQLKSRFNVRTL